ncbi:sensor domain-containing diguanylate cyclase [Neptunicella sp.]|uniref:sensor domain-containing diguanylate cyclase n=1 Tax=Neptunicella sp. TaxID=2125986 RepID=UPI003F6919DB
MPSTHILLSANKPHHYWVVIILGIVLWACYVGLNIDELGVAGYHDPQQSMLSLLNQNQLLGLGMSCGFFAALVLVHLIGFIYTRYRQFLIFSAFTCCLMLTIAAQTDLFLYVWPDNAWLAEHSVSIFAMASLLSALMLFSGTFDTKKFAPILHSFIQYIAIGLGISLVASLIVPTSMLIPAGWIVLCLAMILLGTTCFWFALKQGKFAKSYSIAWSGLLLCVLIISLNNLNIVILPFLPLSLLIIGSLLTTTLLTITLGREYHLDQQQRFTDSQDKLTEEKRLRREQEKAQEELEYSVGERTLELEVALRELSETNRELEEINTIDPLTGIRNRRYFDKKYIAEIRRSRREQTRFCVAMVDIDHFKKVNDQYGHLVGDECIQFVAQALADHLKRPSDDVCRYGGEEFAILLPNTDEQGAVELLEQIIRFIRETPIPTKIGDIQITVSAGIASQVLSIDSQDMTLLETADKALYQSKNAGRDRVTYLPVAPAQTIEP